jgi:acyl-CoA synthetase (AMP-forming)/AMP-acid ligase II
MNRLQQMAQGVLSRPGGERAIQFEGAWIHRAELTRLAHEVARLADVSGADPRAPVLFIARNEPSALAGLLGLVAAGRNVRMLYAFQSPTAIARDMPRLNPGVVVAARREFAPEVVEAVRTQGAAAIALEGMAAACVAGLERSAAPLDPGAPQEPTIEIQTSGTTGPPKHYPVSYDMIATHFVGIVPPMEDSTAAPPPALAYSPLPNLSGMVSTLAPLVRGEPMVLMERLKLDEWRDYVRTYRPGFMGAQPALIQMLVEHEVPPEELACINGLWAGSAPLDPALQLAFEARFGVPIIYAYGATEFLGSVASWTLDLRRQFGDAKMGSVGRAVPNVELRIVDPETGEPLPPGEEGLVSVLATKVRPGWTRTSDVGVIDEDGFLFLRGRADGAIMRGGFKLLPEVIERVLHAHPAVLEAAVAGIPDRRLGQVPAAAIVLRPGQPAPSPGELEQALRERLLATHIPVRWEFVEDLPRTPSMKLDRRGVAALFAEPAVAGGD